MRIMRIFPRPRGNIAFREILLLFPSGRKEENSRNVIWYFVGDQDKQDVRTSTTGDTHSKSKVGR